MTSKQPKYRIMRYRSFEFQLYVYNPNTTQKTIIWTPLPQNTQESQVLPRNLWHVCVSDPQCQVV